MSNIAILFLPLAFSSLPAVLPFVSPSSQVNNENNVDKCWAVNPQQDIEMVAARCLKDKSEHESEPLGLAWTDSIVLFHHCFITLMIDSQVLQRFHPHVRIS